MVKKVSVDKVRKWDIEVTKTGMTTMLLMENAGARIADFIVKKFKNKKILIVFGKGNNGGDVVVAGRHLMTYGFKTGFYSVFREYEYNDILKTQISILKTLNPEFEKNLNLNYDVIVDGIYGTGVRAPIPLEVKNIIEKINNSKKIIISCDVPSGIDADTGNPVDGVAIKPDFTITMAVMKKGLNTKNSGRIILARIGYPFIK